jgi:ABC-type phosphate/phosphonate transport system permease subunit
MSILITLLAFVIVAYLAFWILNQMSMPHPINFIVKAIVGIVLLVALFSISGLALPF